MQNCGRDSPDDAARAEEIRRLPRESAGAFDAGSLVTLAQAAEGFDLRGQASREIQGHLLLSTFADERPVFSPALASEVAPLFDAAGVRWSYIELDSELGHFASGADAGLWADDLSRFVATEPSEWSSWGLGGMTVKKRWLLRGVFCLVILVGLAMLVFVGGGLMLAPSPPVASGPLREVPPPAIDTAPGSHKPTLILLHGAGLNAHMWDAVIRDIDPRWRVLSIDLPGHGARSAEWYSLPAARDAVASAARSVAPAPVVLAGDSLGGYTAMLGRRRDPASAVARPRRVWRNLRLSPPPSTEELDGTPDGALDAVPQGPRRTGT